MQLLLFLKPFAELGFGQIKGKFYQLDALVKTGDGGKGTWRWPVGILKNELRAWPIPVTRVAPEPAVLVTHLVRWSRSAASVTESNSPDTRCRYRTS